MSRFSLVTHRQSEVSKLQKHTQWNRGNRGMGSRPHTRLQAELSEAGLSYPMGRLKPHTHRLGAGGTPWKRPRSGWRVSQGASGSAEGVGEYSPGWRYGGHGSSLGISLHFVSSFAFRLFDCISAWYQCRRNGFYHLPMEVEFPCAPNQVKGSHWVYNSVVGVMGVYDCVERMIVSFWISLSFVSLIYWLVQSRRSVPRERDNVTATPEPRPGKRLCILIAAATIKSVLNILLPFSGYILTWSRVQLYTISNVCGPT